MIGVGYSENNIKYIFTTKPLAEEFVEKYNSYMNIVIAKLQEYENVIANIKSKWLEENTPKTERLKILNTLRRIEQLRVFEENKETILRTSFSDYDAYKSLSMNDLRKLCIVSDVITNPSI